MPSPATTTSCSASTNREPRWELWPAGYLVSFGYAIRIGSTGTDTSPPPVAPGASASPDQPVGVAGPDAQAHQTRDRGAELAGDDHHHRRQPPGLDRGQHAAGIRGHVDRPSSRAGPGWRRPAAPGGHARIAVARPLHRDRARRRARGGRRSRTGRPASTASTSRSSRARSAGRSPSSSRPRHRPMRRPPRRRATDPGRRHRRARALTGRWISD